MLWKQGQTQRNDVKMHQSHSSISHGRGGGTFALLSCGIPHTQKKLKLSKGWGKGDNLNAMSPCFSQIAFKRCNNHPCMQPDGNGVFQPVGGRIGFSVIRGGNTAPKKNGIHSPTLHFKENFHTAFKKSMTGFKTCAAGFFLFPDYPMLQQQINNTVSETASLWLLIQGLSHTSCDGVVLLQKKFSLFSLSCSCYAYIIGS